MNEAERIKLKLKKQRTNDLMLYICIIMFVALSTCLGIVMFANRYRPDPSLYIEYDLSKDLIPDPVQTKIEKDSFMIQKFGVDIKITKLASYDITGKVEAIKDYSSNFFSNFLNFEAENMTNYISPRDLTLSWGPIALDENSNSIKADQNYLNSERVVWYTYTDSLKKKYGEEYILSHISNNHVVTLNRDLKRELLKIKQADIVRIKGYLIEVNCSNGINWGPSSLLRDDHGFHSCEILYAEDIVILNKK